MSVRKPTGNGGPEWSNPNSNIAYLTSYGNTEKSDVTATNSSKLTTSQLEALSKGSPVSSGPSLASTGAPSAGGMSPPLGGYTTEVAPPPSGGTTTPTGTTTPAGPTRIPLLWVILGVIGLVVLIALSGR